MGCIHCSKISPEVGNQDTNGEKATRRGGIWRLIRRCRKNRIRPTTEVTPTNLIPHQNVLIQDNLGPWQNDVRQDNLDPCQNNIPRETLTPWPNDVLKENLPLWRNDVLEENLNLIPWHNGVLEENVIRWRNDVFEEKLIPWHNDVLEEKLIPWHKDVLEEKLIPWHNDVLEEKLIPWHNDVLEEKFIPWRNDVLEEKLIPWHNDVLEENLVPRHNDALQDNLGPSQSDHVLHVVPLQIDVLKDKLGSCHSDVLQGTLPKVDIQVDQQPGEEDNADLSDKEVDHAQETATDSLCEAGPLERWIVNSYLKGILPSCSDEDNHEGTESRPVDSLQQHTSVSNKLESILKRPGLIVPGRKSEKRVSFSASTVDVKTPDPDNTSELPRKLLVEIPSCECVGCRTGCEEPEPPQSTANPSNGSSLKKPQIKLVPSRPSRVLPDDRNEFQSVQVKPKTGRQESSAAYKKPVSKSARVTYMYSPIIPTFNSYWGVSESIPYDGVNKRTKKALEEIKRLGEPTLVEKYAKLHTNKGFLLGE